MQGYTTFLLLYSLNKHLFSEILPLNKSLFCEANFLYFKKDIVEVKLEQLQTKSFKVNVLQHVIG